MLDARVSPDASTPADPDDRLLRAVRRSGKWSADGVLERLFTFLFRGLVYPQIWEDPVVDMAALQLGPGDRLITIASGGCNALSYLTADPQQVIAVDLNETHVALVELKLAGFRHAPSYQAMYRFFGEASNADNPRFYDRVLAPHLSAKSRAYWEGRTWTLQRRVAKFSGNLYRTGLLGKFIGVGHLGARALGVRLKDMLACEDQAAQRAFFDAQVAPMFESRLVRFVTKFKASLFGLGIPPAQYDSLAVEGDGDMAVVLKRRLEKLLCDFPLHENYFAWQALAQRYAGGDDGPLPPYLQRAQFDAVRFRVGRMSIEHRSVTERLAQEPDGSMDAFVLLDAQDWMTDGQLNDLWDQITRTATPGARAIFRTADIPSLLPGRVRDETLAQWRYEAADSQAFGAQDRSAIYGGFHLYVRKGPGDV